MYLRIVRTFYRYTLRAEPGVCENLNVAQERHYNPPVIDLRIVDSITQLGASDQGCIAVSGSHGGISSARYALAARPSLSVFNDAGVGKDGAGLAALAFLQSHGLAACTVSHDSARIGEAQSTLDDGVISHANALAAALSVKAGQNCRTLVERLRSGA